MARALLGIRHGSCLTDFAFALHDHGDVQLVAHKRFTQTAGIG